MATLFTRAADMVAANCGRQKSSEVEEIRDIVTCAICLELFENGCLLSCSHTYCLMCLHALCEDSLPSQHTKCPQCRQLSIPPSSSLNQLPSHVFANQLADLVRKEDGGILDTVEYEDSEDMYVGEPLKLDESEQRTKRSKGRQMAINMLKGVATVASLGLGGLYLGYKARQRRRRRELLAQNPNESFTCANCNTLQYYSEDELRYKCGMCEDLNLCHSCASSNIARVHRPDHILVKLKFRQRRQLPPGCILRYRKSRDMSEAIDFTTVIHSRAFYHTPECIEWTEAISCSFCGESPIVGTRYKCGMCKDYDLCESCEEHSHQIHDKDHAFLVLKNKVKVNVISEPLIKALLY